MKRPGRAPAASSARCRRRCRRRRWRPRAAPGCRPRRRRRRRTAHRRGAARAAAGDARLRRGPRRRLRREVAGAAHRPAPWVNRRCSPAPAGDDVLDSTRPNSARRTCRRRSRVRAGREVGVAGFRRKARTGRPRGAAWPRRGRCRRQSVRRCRRRRGGPPGARAARRGGAPAPRRHGLEVVEQPDAADAEGAVVRRRTRHGTLVRVAARSRIGPATPRARGRATPRGAEEAVEQGRQAIEVGVLTDLASTRPARCSRRSNSPSRVLDPPTSAARSMRPF